MFKFLLGSIFCTVAFVTQAASVEISFLSEPSEATECTYNSGECPGAGWFCLNGRCVQENTGERCYVNTDCPVGSSCISGVCR